MGNWRIWAVDLAVNRFAASQVLASNNPDYAAYLVDARNTTRWVSGATAATTRFGILLDAAQAINAVAFGNGRNIEGETLNIWETTTLLGTPTNQLGAVDWQTGSFDILKTFASNSAKGVMIDFLDTISATLALGTFSVLSTAGMIEFDAATEGVIFPIGQAMHPGYSEMQLAGGDTIRHTNSGPLRRWIINLDALALTKSTGTYDVLRDSFNDNNGWIDGVWLVTDEHDNSAYVQAYYCHPTASSPVQMAQMLGGAYGHAVIELVEFPRGPV